MQFYYVYKTVQHPGINNFVRPFTLEERLLHVAEAERRTGSKIPWLCDRIDNATKHSLGAAPNAEYLIDPEGKIIRKRFWSNPRALRKALEKHVGKVKSPTSPDDVEAIFQVEPRPVASGVVPRLTLPSLTAVMTTPRRQDAKQKFYVKLRVEVERSLLPSPGRPKQKSRPRKGKLYLGLFLDPIYKVHWNNRAGRIQVELSGEGYGFEKKVLRGPEVKEDADVDPREFLVNVRIAADAKPQPIDVTVKYIGCDDAKTFCLPITQHYQVELKQDRDAGSRPGVFMPRMFAKVGEFDTNGDGRITAAELPPGRVTLFLGHLDLNDDEVIDAKERESFFKMFNNGRGLQPE